MKCSAATVLRHRASEPPSRPRLRSSGSRVRPFSGTESPVGSPRTGVSIPGRARGSWVSSTWHWRTDTSARSRPSSRRTTSGGPSPRFSWRTRTATRRPRPTRWTLLVPTPPIPDHDSAHSVEGGAAAQVLRRFFGIDRVLRDGSLTLPAGSTCRDASPVLRRFTSFSRAAEENGLSRILVGFHFRKAVEDGSSTVARSAIVPSTGHAARPRLSTRSNPRGLHLGPLQRRPSRGPGSRCACRRTGRLWLRIVQRAQARPGLAYEPPRRTRSPGGYSVDVHSQTFPAMSRRPYGLTPAGCEPTGEVEPSFGPEPTAARPSSSSSPQG